MTTVDFTEVARGLRELYKDEITAALVSAVALDYLLQKHWLVEFLEDFVIAAAIAAGHHEIHRRKFAWKGV